MKKIFKHKEAMQLAKKLNDAEQNEVKPIWKYSVQTRVFQDNNYECKIKRSPLIGTEWLQTDGTWEAD